MQLCVYGCAALLSQVAIDIAPLQAQSLPDLDADRLYDRVWAQYLPTLHRHFIAHLELDDALRSTLARHRPTTVRLHLVLDRHGRVQTATILQASALPRFTRACAQAARELGRLPSLPPAILQRGHRNGLEFTFGTGNY